MESQKHSNKLALEKFKSKLYRPFKIVNAKGQHAFKLEISPTSRIHLTFHASLLEPYQAFVPEGRQQPPPEPEVINGDLEWEVEWIEKCEIISYTRKVRGGNKRMRELRYFDKCKGCSEDENTWQPPQSLENRQE